MLLVACGEKKKAPESSEAIHADSVISQNKMILILADVHVIEASMLLARNEGGSSKEMTAYYYKGLFGKYHISPARYDQNLLYYRQNPENYAKMYEKVIKILENQQSRFADTK
ncbi:MAG: DUF4296 domain-containing protein [Bacteroidetes bacterium]|nr:DUF4296 domain-containing protein [Bacteroidota bacterium]